MDISVWLSDRYFYLKCLNQVGKMQKISDGFIHLIVRWIILSKMLDVRKDAARTWTLNTLLGEELLLSDLNQLTQSPEHDLGRNTSLVFRLVSNCTGSNSIWSWNIRINCETYRNFRCTCALFMIRMETAFEIFLLHGLAFHCLAFYFIA